MAKKKLVRAIGWRRGGWIVIKTADKTVYYPPARRHIPHLSLGIKIYNN